MSAGRPLKRWPRVAASTARVQLPMAFARVRRIGVHVEWAFDAVQRYRSTLDVLLPAEWRSSPASLADRRGDSPAEVVAPPDALDHGLPLRDVGA